MAMRKGEREEEWRSDLQNRSLLLLHHHHACDWQGELRRCVCRHCCFQKRNRCCEFLQMRKHSDDSRGKLTRKKGVKRRGKEGRKRGKGERGRGGGRGKRRKRKPVTIPRTCERRKRKRKRKKKEKEKVKEIRQLNERKGERAHECRAPRREGRL